MGFGGRGCLAWGVGVWGSMYRAEGNQSCDANQEV